MKYSLIAPLMVALLIKLEVLETLPDFSSWSDPTKVRWSEEQNTYLDHSLEGEHWALCAILSSGKRMSEPTKVPMKKSLALTIRTDLFYRKTTYIAVTMLGMVRSIERKQSRRLVLVNVEQMLNEQAGDLQQYRVWPHLGLIFVGTVADEEGYEVVIWDEYAKGNVPLEKLVQEGDIVGLSLVVTGMDRGMMLARRAKELGAACVIAGNDSAIFRANQVMAQNDRPIDAVFTTNSLTAVRQFLREIGRTPIEELDIPGVQMTARGEVRSNERDQLLIEQEARKSSEFNSDDVFVVPKLELYPHWEELWTNYRATFGHKHSNPKTVKNAISLFAQGCTRTRGSDVCLYCTIAGVADLRTPSEEIVRRTIEAYDKFGIDMLYNATDSVYEMAKVVSQLQRLGASWKSMTIYGRAQGIARAPHLIEEWQKVATERLLVNVGMDSGSDEILHKGIVKSSTDVLGSRLAENRNAVKYIRQSGAHLHYSLIFGSPGETLETCESSIEFLEWTIEVLGSQLDICETDVFWLNFGSPASRIFREYAFAVYLASLAGKTIERDEWQRDFAQYANELVVPQSVEESWYRHFTNIEYETAQLFNQRAAEIMSRHTGSIRGRAFRPA
ncbi:MAG: hypothetical protein V4664_02355 [Patescibacteria group bacterium]